ncbi:MAG: hypothetical protein QOH06_5059 [Acidobacteriota bacterium]|nr:hypothetical protein [Acidobacteriota bacterium]
MHEKPKFWIALRGLTLFSFILASWAVALLAVRQTDLLSLPVADFATLTFGASSLFLFMFSFGLGMLGLVSWQAINSKIRELAGKAAQEAAEAKLEDVVNELRGRTFSTIGYITGEMSLLYEDSLIRIVDRERLAEAIATLWQGYEFLSRIKDEKVEYMVLNNLVFYSLINDDKARTGFLLEKAEDLMRVGKEHDAINLMLTASGVFAFYAVDRGKQDEVIMLLKDFQESPRLSSKRRNEARYYLNVVSERTNPRRK